MVVVDGCGATDVVVLVRGSEETLVLPEEGRAPDEWTVVIAQAAISTRPRPSTKAIAARSLADFMAAS